MFSSKPIIPLSSQAETVSQAIKELGVLCKLPASFKDTVKSRFDKLMALCPQVLSVVKFNYPTTWATCMESANKNEHVEICNLLSTAKRRDAKGLTLDISEIVAIGIILKKTLSSTQASDNRIREDFHSSLSKNNALKLTQLLNSHKKTLFATQEMATAYLGYAITFSPPKIVQGLLEQMTAEQINGKCLDYTALQQAVLQDKPATVQVLLENKKVDRNIKSNEELTAAFYAALENNPEILSKFLKVMDETECNIRGQGGIDLLHCAVNSNALATVKMLLNDSRVKRTTKAHLGTTPLHYAAYHGRKEIVALLLEKIDQADINEINTAQKTALHLAVEQRQTDIVRMLLQLPSEKRPNLNLKDNQGNTPFGRAVKDGLSDLMMLFLEKLDTTAFNRVQNRGCPLLFSLIHEENSSGLKLILQDPRFKIGNIKSQLGRTPLHEAILHNKTALAIKFLSLMTMDEINARTNDDCNALFFAVYKGNLHLVEKLLEHKVEFNKSTTVNHTVLDIAAHCGHTTIAEKLLQDPRAKEISLCNALLIAVKNDHLEIVRLLLEQMQPEAINTPTKNPFWYALKNKKESIKIFLDSPKVSLTAPPLPVPPLHFAVFQGDYALINSLGKHPRIDKEQTYDDLTAFDLAEKHYFQLGIQLLTKSKVECSSEQSNLMQNKKTSLSIIRKSLTSLRPSNSDLTSKEIDHWDKTWKKLIEIMKEEKNHSLNLDSQLEDLEPIREEKTTVKHQGISSSFFPSSASSVGTLDVEGYYKLTAPNLEEKSGLPVYAYVTPATIEKAKKGEAWNFMETQLKHAPKLIGQQDEHSGIKSLGSGRYELANTKQARIWTTAGSTPRKIPGLGVALVLEFNEYGDHKALKKKSSR